MAVGRWGIALGLVAAAACGGGDGGGGSGVEGSKLLLEITDNDAVALCNYWRDLYADVYPSADRFCSYNAEDEDAASCNEDRQTCLDENYFDEATTYDEGCEDAKADDLVPQLEGDCQATVAEYEGCLRHLIQLQKAAVKSAQCDGTLSPAEEAELSEDDMPSAACLATAACFGDA